MQPVLGIRLERLRSLPTLFDHTHGDRVQLQRTVAIPLRALHPPHVIRIRCRAQLASCDAAQVVGDYVVMADPALFAVNALADVRDQSEMRRRRRLMR